MFLRADFLCRICEKKARKGGLFVERIGLFAIEKSPTPTGGGAYRRGFVHSFPQPCQCGGASPILRLLLRYRQMF